MQNKLTISKDQIQEMIAHAQAALPNEACGILGGHAGRVQTVYPGENVENSPVIYRMKPQDQLRAMHAIQLSGGDLLGIFHSHTNGSTIPSETDISQAHYPDSVYIILARPPNGAWKTFGYNITKGNIHKITLQVEPGPYVG